MKKILINTPDIHGIGGVASHYAGLVPYWNCKVKYNSLGPRCWRKLLIPFTTFRYLWYLISFKPDMVLLNPSMGNGALKRDFFYMKLARLSGRKVAIFIHGFNLDYVSRADWTWISSNLNKSSKIIVLADRFRKILQSNNITVPIFLSTTKVPDSMLDGFDIDSKDGKLQNILMLSRIEKEKGVFEAVDTYSILKNEYPCLRLTFAGDGSAIPLLKKYVAKKRIPDVVFTGPLYGNDVADAYRNADFFIFPSYGEGMPTSVLEAMAFGLPVLTRSVGGLCDFFEDGKMGRITDSLDSEQFAALIRPYIENAQLTKQVSRYNHSYALSHFMASKVAEGLENILFES